MIAVTDRAATELQQLLEANAASPDQGVKLVPDESGRIGMVIASPAEGDQVVRRGAEPLLIVDQSLAQLLDDVVLDVEAGGESGQASPQFLLRRAAGPES